MRVLYLNPFSQEVSGPDESLRTLLGALIPRGVEAHVVLPLALLRRDLSVEAALYPVRLTRAVAAIVGIARTVGADLVHTNMEVLLEGGLAAALLRKPLTDAVGQVLVVGHTSDRRLPRKEQRQ